MVANLIRGPYPRVDECGDIGVSRWIGRVTKNGVSKVLCLEGMGRFGFARGDAGI